MEQVVKQANSVGGYLDLPYYLGLIQDVVKLGLHEPIGIDWELTEAYLKDAFAAGVIPDLEDLGEEFEWIVMEDYELSPVFQVDSAIFPFKYAFVEREYQIGNEVAVCALHTFDSDGEPCYLEEFAGFIAGFSLAFEERTLFFVKTEEQTIKERVIGCLKMGKEWFQLGRANRPRGAAWDYYVTQKGLELQVNQLKPSACDREALEGAVLFVIDLNKIIEDPQPEDFYQVHQLIKDLGVEFLYPYYGMTPINQMEFDQIQQALDQDLDPFSAAKQVVFEEFEEQQQIREEEGLGWDDCVPGQYSITTDLSIHPIQLNDVIALAECVQAFLKAFYGFEFEVQAAA